ncbi:probable glutamate receptor [Panulirus ornatus]|uniref:probable glutamate receptor n=1 Tax=Panulirus ornatus TaxID=150431 RepID=UPI003A8A902E
MCCYSSAWNEEVRVYGRCLYCSKGKADVREIRQWRPIAGGHITDNIFLGQREDFMGHQFDVVAMPFFPLSSFTRNSEDLGTTYTLLDSVDIRMMNSFKGQANFTYEVREPWDGQWGVDLPNGNWTGIIGTLQHQQADFSLNIDLTSTRIHVVDYSILYTQDGLALFSLKPGLQPQYLAIFRPFIGEVWLILFVSFLVWCVALWLMQRVWSLMTGGQKTEVSYVFLYGWSVLMEEFSSTPTVYPFGRRLAFLTLTHTWVYLQVLVGLWMLACVILTNTYRSSLVAHLTVQDKMPAINSFQDLLARDGWGWGTSFTNDATMLYYKHHPSSDVQKIYEGMQARYDVELNAMSSFAVKSLYRIYANMDEQFRRVLKGSYSHITYKSPGMAVVAVSMTDSRGYTPIHVSRTVYPYSLGIG